MYNVNDTLDKRSEYYRICPFCKKKFMASHMNRAYCSDECGDKFNNSKKRFNRTVSLGQEPVVKTSSELLDQKIEANISILNALIANPNKENYFTPEFLVHQGFDFDGINGRTAIAGQNTGQFMLRVGPYRITRPEKGNLCIKYLKILKL